MRKAVHRGVNVNCGTFEHLRCSLIFKDGVSFCRPVGVLECEQREAAVLLPLCCPVLGSTVAAAAGSADCNFIFYMHQLYDINALVRAKIVNP